MAVPVVCDYERLRSIQMDVTIMMLMFVDKNINQNLIVVLLG
jgi:hypothetical protein